jgi:hypothetical protein
LPVRKRQVIGLNLIAHSTLNGSPEIVLSIATAQRWIDEGGP